MNEELFVDKLERVNWNQYLECINIKHFRIKAREYKTFHPEIKKSLVKLIIRYFNYIYGEDMYKTLVEESLKAKVWMEEEQKLNKKKVLYFTEGVPGWMNIHSKVEYITNLDLSYKVKAHNVNTSFDKITKKNISLKITTDIGHDDLYMHRSCTISKAQNLSDSGFGTRIRGMFIYKHSEANSPVMLQHFTEEVINSINFCLPKRNQINKEEKADKLQRIKNFIRTLNRLEFYILFDSDAHLSNYKRLLIGNGLTENS